MNKGLESSLSWIKTPQLSEEVLRNPSSSLDSILSPDPKSVPTVWEFLKKFRPKTAITKPSTKTLALTSNPALFSSVKADFSRSSGLFLSLWFPYREFSSPCFSSKKKLLVALETCPCYENKQNI